VGTLIRCGSITQEKVAVDKLTQGSLQVSSPIDKGTQILLRLQFRELVRLQLPLPPFHEVEFRNFSQTGEDGILHYIFSLIGTTNRCVVEMCAGDGRQCNAANLVINHAWRGYLFDGDERNVAIGNAFYYACSDTFLAPPVFRHAWITAENVNQLLAEQNVFGEIDLFSLDVDGVDYWIWKALDIIHPRVVILEFNPSLGGTRTCTVPYQADFICDFNDETGLTYFGTSPIYYGASLAAFAELAKEKGYRLVGVNRYRFNAFFVRNDIGVDLLPEISLSSLFNPTEAKLEAIDRLIFLYPWVEV
jgi:hypothetical protein